MSLLEAEKRREARRSADRDDDDDGRGAAGSSASAIGVSLVAALALLGGAADLLAGVALLATRSS